MKRRFQDFDEMTQTLQAWNLDIVQLYRGRFRGDIHQLGTGCALVARAVFNRATWQRGIPPEGFRTFGFLTDPLPHLVWRKHKVSMNTVMTFPPGGELDAVTRGDSFKVYTLSFSEELLADSCRSMGLPDLKDLIGNAEVVQRDPAAMRQLIDFLHRICREYREYPSEMRSHSMRRTLEVEVPRRFLAVLASTWNGDIGSSVRGRDRVLERLENIIARIPSVIPKIHDLCRTAQVSERTLEYAFRDRFGMTPVSYLKSIRLNDTRRELMESDLPSTRIAEVAGRWGFRHMGQFAADFHAQFGELPSKALERRRNSRAPVRS